MKIHMVSLGAALLATSLALGASAAHAQRPYPHWGPRPWFSVGVFAPPIVIGAPLFVAPPPRPIYVAPPPVHAAPPPGYAYPAPRYAAPAPGYFYPY